MSAEIAAAVQAGIDARVDEPIVHAAAALSLGYRTMLGLDGTSIDDAVELVVPAVAAGQHLAGDAHPVVDGARRGHHEVQQSVGGAGLRDERDPALQVADVGDEDDGDDQFDLDGGHGDDDDDEIGGAFDLEIDDDGIDVEKR